VPLDENLATCVHGALRVVAEDQHHCRAVDDPALQTKSLGCGAEIDASRLLQRRDEGRRGAARFQQVVRHAAVLIRVGTRRAGPSALNLSATTPLRLEATSRSRSSLASSPRI